MVETATIYRKNGETLTVDAIDARQAVHAHPEDWATTPWPEKKPEPVKEPVTPAKKYEAKHQGRGVYSVFDATGAEVLDKLTKEDAELFNAGSDGDQEAFIQAEQAKRASS